MDSKVVSALLALSGFAAFSLLIAHWCNSQIEKIEKKFHALPPSPRHREVEQFTEQAIADLKLARSWTLAVGLACTFIVACTVVLSL